MRLEIPDTRYPDWSRFLAAVWGWGTRTDTYEPGVAKYHCWRAGEAASGSLVWRQEQRKVRPSSFINCARQTFFMREGHDPQPMPPNIGLTFAVGHFLHELSYGAITSALPDGFKASFEVDVDLPEWWPKNAEWANDRGHVDCIIEVTDKEKAGKYLDVSEKRKALVDFKTMGGYSYREHKKKDYTSVADGFGYLSQLAVYAGTVQPDVILLAGISRDQLTAPLVARQISKDTLETEKKRMMSAFADDLKDPGPELLDRWGEEAHFYCGGGRRSGYCPFRERCHATHPGG